MEKKFHIGKNKIMITPIHDYYGTDKNGSGMNTNINENSTYDVGIVKAVGDSDNEDWVGHIIFHTKGFGDVLNMPGIGKFVLIDLDFKIIVRLDQNINNYKN